MFKNFPGAIRLLEDGPVGILVSRLSDGLIREANAAFIRLVGYSSHELVGATAGKLALWLHADERAAMVESITCTGHLINLPVDIRCKSGAVVHVSCSALRIDLADEAHILTLVEPHPKVVLSREAIANEIAHLDIVEASGAIGFWDIDVRSGHVRWSYGMEAIYGMPKGGFKGTAEDFIQRVHPDDLERNLRESREALEQKRPFDITFRIVRPDGAVRWVVSRGTARFEADGSYVGASGLQMDISDQVARDQQMRLQSQVIESMAEGVIMVNADTATILFANPRMEHMLGYAPGALVGLPVQDINARSERDPAEVAQAIMAELRSHGQWRGEVKNRRADGSEFWTTCTVSTFRRAELAPVWISVHTDITERRNAQEARDKALRQLQRLALNYQDSIEAERLAVSRDVHDQLGASLTGMRMRLEALCGKLGRVAPQAAADLNELLVDVGKTQLAAREICTRLRPALLDDLGLAQACRWYLRDWSAQTGIAATSRICTLKLQPDSKTSTDMFRVLQEFLTNVARHSRANKVHVALHSTGTVVTLRVQDDGHGFTPDQESGGYGLPGVRERLRHHGGALHIDSNTQGTRMTATMEVLPS